MTDGINQRNSHERSVRIQTLWNRQASLELSFAQFHQLAHMFVDHIAEFLQSMPQRPVTPGESPKQIRALLRKGLKTAS
ncbi:MAG: hypothetical protein A2Z45_07765 [Chloroflexi bacterium RBG_19FT_COMBO_55_16]|nr:MAG: hypothetical protein A2Z45_07765 [Chloroflexi bacterium RBG_19FT_COMBO_55_16]